MENDVLIRFKKQNDLFFDNDIVTINDTIEKEYKKYQDNPYKYKVEIDFKIMLKCCNSMNAQLIPYSALTDTIFRNDIKEYSKFSNSIYETDFASMIEGAFDKFLTSDIKYESSKSTQVNNSKPFGKSSEDDEQSRSIESIEKYLEDNKQEIIVFYKIIEHLRLAINQKNGLYTEQKIDILNLTDKINQTKETYDSMISNYISILGILAAILMTAFGGIQAFTAIYNKSNGFSVVDSVIIACIGFLGIILMIFMLLNGISKLAGKSISSNNGKGRWFQRHPTLLYSFTILSSIIIILLTYKMVIYKPVYSHYWLFYAIPVCYIILLICTIKKIEK